MLGWLAFLFEVAPSLVVDWHRGVRAEQLAEFDSIFGGHGELDRSGDREVDGAEVHDGGADVDAFGDMAYAVVEHRVAGDPHGAVVLGRPR